MKKTILLAIIFSVIACAQTKIAPPQVKQQQLTSSMWYSNSSGTLIPLNIDPLALTITILPNGTAVLSVKPPTTTTVASIKTVTYYVSVAQQNFAIPVEITEVAKTMVHRNGILQTDSATGRLADYTIDVPTRMVVFTSVSLPVVGDTIIVSGITNQ